MQEKLSSENTLCKNEEKTLFFERGKCFRVCYIIANRTKWLRSWINVRWSDYAVKSRFCNFLFQMIKVDVIAALDMHVERGEWEKCIQTAEQEVK